jgi:hypothetical protein
VLAAIVVAVGVWPVLAHDGGQPLPANRELAPQADWTPGDGPGAEELDRLAEDEIDEQSFPVSHPLVIPAAAFHSQGDNVEDYNFSPSDGSLYEDGATTVCMQAPVYLPDGATVTGFYGYLYDNTASASVDLTLYRVRNQYGTQDEMAYVSTDGLAEIDSILYREDTSINEPLVSDLYSYFIYTCFESDGGSDIRIYAARIFFTEELFLPLILMNSM